MVDRFDGLTLILGVMTPYALQVALIIGSVAIALVGVAAYLPATWKWPKIILMLLAAGALSSVVSTGLDIAKEESVRAQATRNALWQYLETTRRSVVESWTAEGADIASLQSPPVDDWGNPSHLERHGELLVVWSFGRDGARDFESPPASCLDRARPHSDVLLGIDRKGTIRRLQVPGLSGDPTCSRAPDAPAPRYFYPVMITQALLALVFGRRLWSHLRVLAETEPTGEPTPPVAPFPDLLQAGQEFRWRYPTLIYSAMLAGVGGAAGLMLAAPRLATVWGEESFLGDLFAALPDAPWIVVPFCVLYLWGAAAILPSGVRFEPSGEVQFTAVGVGESVSTGEELSLVKLTGSYVAGRRSLLILPFFERADELADLLEARAADKS